MIQGQFDAAARLGTSISQLSGGESDEHGFDERPRKRRKTSPPVEDSIEVAAASPCYDTASTVEGHSIEVVKAKGNCPRSPKGSVNNEASHIRDGNTTPKAQSEESEESEEKEAVAKNGEKSDNLIDYDKEILDPAEEEVVLLEEALQQDDAPGQREDGGTTVDGPGPPDPPQDTEHKGEEPHHSAEVTPQAAQTSSQTLSKHSSAGEQRPLSDLGHAKRNNTHTLSNSPTPPQPSLGQDQAAAPSTGPSTPKKSSSSDGETKSSSPLSSPPTEISNPFDEGSTEPPPSSSRPSSPVSDDDEGDDEEGENGEEGHDDQGEPSPSQEQFSRSSTFRRSLSTLKGRELFDASIWADPLKTSVFYTFATNLRQKSRDASPTGCHHFISHLSRAGKMVRCYTQNIDLLEDKVGLSTRLLLGPGSRSRFSTRVSKNVVGAATQRNPGDHKPQPALVQPVSGSTGPESTCQHATVDGRGAPGGADPANIQETPSSLSDIVEADHRRASIGGPGVAERSSDQSQEPDRGHGGDGTTAAQLIDANSTNPYKSLPRTDSGCSTPERDRGVECVFLHGSLQALRCFQCGCVANWDEADRELQTMSGSQPPCPRCEDATVARQERGKRALGVGKLRPDVVLYGEEHPESQRISTIIQHDISLAPDMLIIMGTSLKVHGLKTVVREFAKTVHNRKDGKVIFINYTKPADSVWADIIDFWVEMDCDAWIDDLKEKKPIIWLPPGSVEEESRSTKRRRPVKDEPEKRDSKKMKKIEDIKDPQTNMSAPPPLPPANPMITKLTKIEKIDREVLLEASKPPPKRPAAWRECKQNAAYWTTKIWADLASMVGREVTPMVTSAPSKAVPVATVAVPPVESSPGTQSATPTEPLMIKRRPRTKNTKSRKAVFEAPEASGSIEEPLKALGKVAKLAKTQRGQLKPATDEKHKRKPNRSRAGIPIVPTEASAIPPGDGHPASDAFDVKQETSGPSAVRDGSVLAEMPLPNSGLNQCDADNSIVSAVKSNHRIRKPKAIFGETALPSNPPSRLATPALGTSTKSRARVASHARKTKASVQDEEAEQASEARQPQVLSVRASQRPILPEPRPRPAPTAVHTPQPTGPLESCQLPPIRPSVPELQPVNVGRRASFLELALGPSPTAAPNTTSPPDYLEPVVSPGPKDISPMSPHHWQNRAFTFQDPLYSRHYEPPRRPLDFTAPRHPQDSPGPPVPTIAPAPPRAGPFGQGQRPILGDAPKLYTEHSFVARLSPPGPVVPAPDDSPSRQLQRETYDAAAALSQMSQQQPVVYDTRQFARASS